MSRALSTFKISVFSVASEVVSKFLALISLAAKSPFASLNTKVLPVLLVVEFIENAIVAAPA